MRWIINFSKLECLSIFKSFSNETYKEYKKYIEIENYINANPEKTEIIKQLRLETNTMSKKLFLIDSIEGWLHRSIIRGGKVALGELEIRVIIHALNDRPDNRAKDLIHRLEIELSTYKKENEEFVDLPLVFSS